MFSLNKTLINCILYLYEKPLVLNINNTKIVMTIEKYLNLVKSIKQQNFSLKLFNPKYSNREYIGKLNHVYVM